MIGLKLDGGWTVVSRLERGRKSTGGTFSIGYLVKHEDGRVGFLKAQDLASVLGRHDLFRTLEKLTTEFNFERDVLEKCREHRMSRVATAIDEGSVEVDGFSFPLSHVRYLIFEKADSDVRAHLDKEGLLDLAWKLRCLHHVATGLQQLHRRGIAHQDLKPSNVLIFERAESKVADLGRACDRSAAGPWDEMPGPCGDRGYAPPELLYGKYLASWEGRLGCDAYLLGSLVTFVFSGVPVTAAVSTLLIEEQQWHVWGEGFEAVLPFLRAAFEQFVTSFERAVESLPLDITSQLVGIVRQLCDPDPRLRGHPSVRGNPLVQFDLDRYVTLFDRLSRRAELQLRRG